MLANGLHEHFGNDVDAQIDDFKALALEHERGDVLSDIVQVACHRADDDGAAVFRERMGGRLRFEDEKSRVRRA